MITAVSIVRVSLTDNRCFVHLIGVEFSKYIELVDLVDFRYLNSTQLFDDRLDRFRGLIVNVVLSYSLLHHTAHIQGGPKKVSSKLLSICLQNIDRFSNFFTGVFCEKFVVTTHTITTLTASLHYRVKYKICKIHQYLVTI